MSDVAWNGIRIVISVVPVFVRAAFQSVDQVINTRGHVELPIRVEIAPVQIGNRSEIVTFHVMDDAELVAVARVVILIATRWWDPMSRWIIRLRARDRAKSNGRTE